MSPAVEAQAQEAMDAEQKQKQQQQQNQLKNQLQHQQCYMEKGVMLEPFVHQVGGHSCVLRFGEQTICKPLIPREHQFYKSLPAAMRKFTPQYRAGMLKMMQSKIQEEEEELREGSPEKVNIGIASEKLQMTADQSTDWIKSSPHLFQDLQK